MRACKSSSQNELRISFQNMSFRGDFNFQSKRVFLKIENVRCENLIYTAHI